MRVQLEELPPDRADRLRRVIQARGLGEGTLYLPGARRWLAVLGLLALGAGLVSARILMSGFSDWPSPADAFVPWIGLLALIYGPLALAEYVRILRAECPPFLLLTPFNLVKSRGSHRPLEVYRLTEACAFQRAEEYSRTKWTGQSLAFRFDGGDKLKFTLHRREDIEAADRILTLARTAGQGEPLPDLPSCRLGDLGPGYFHPAPKPGRIEKFLDPASETWLVILGLLCLAFLPYAIFR